MCVDLTNELLFLDRLEDASSGATRLRTLLEDCELTSEVDFGDAATTSRVSCSISSSRDLEAAARSALEDIWLLPKMSTLGLLSCLKTSKPDIILAGSGEASIENPHASIMVGIPVLS